MKNNNVIFLSILLLLICCKPEDQNSAIIIESSNYLTAANGILNYVSNPKDKNDRDMLMFSDQGAWFTYGLPNDETTYGGFTGPFLLTQENGVWISPCLTQLQLTSGSSGQKIIDWKEDLIQQNSYASHLDQTYENTELKTLQQLVFLSGHTALQRTTITNISNASIPVKSAYKGSLFELGITATSENNMVKIKSTKSNALGTIQLINRPAPIIIHDSLTFEVQLEVYTLKPKESVEFIIAQSFIFPEYSMEEEQLLIADLNFDEILNSRKLEKEKELAALIENRKPVFAHKKYAAVLSKAQLTLQNNWRIPAGELKHQGLFPSYQYEWFHGFWSWDSWKHAVGLSYYNPALAKDQIRAMFDYQLDDGFIIDCIYRDTTIEAHNYRDTKPPLSAWAVAEIVKKDSDKDFIEEMYPKLLRYHNWWYAKRDHDQDGLCEFGSTDGTVLAAKWESGMDNAIRFDGSKILKNSEGAYSLDQESIDLNAYLYAEKLYLAYLAEKLGKKAEAKQLREDAADLKIRIQEQFYDPEDGWFYDTNLDGDTFIKGAGSEGWTPLWAQAATQSQAEVIKIKMMDPKKFYSKVPFQTMSMDHPKFDPLNGYWRGPNWLDQAYFGVKGLRNYGFNTEADQATAQILEGAEGVLDKGTSIRENYHPLTGEGLYAENFSWSAAHIIMMLMKD